MFCRKYVLYQNCTNQNSRGGCGSTYGIVTQATVRAFPSPKMTVAKIILNATDADGLIEPLAYLHSVMPELSEKGVQGYYISFPKQFIGTFHTVGNLANAEAAAKIWDPVLAKLATYPGLVKDTAKAKYLNYPSYKTYFDATWGAAEPDEKMKRDMNEEPIREWWTGELRPRNALHRRHGPGESKSQAQSMGKTNGDGRLLDRAALTSPKFAAALKAAMPSKPGKMIRGALIGGGEVIKRSPTESSVHPSWRKTYVTFWSDKDVDDMAKMAPDMGAYINEVIPVLLLYMSLKLIVNHRRRGTKPTGRTSSGAATTPSSLNSRPSMTQTCCSMLLRVSTPSSWHQTIRERSAARQVSASPPSRP
jgi:hypothetical protein